MIALPYLSAVRFSGADAGDFLHNQLSADVLGMTEGKSTFACYCEPKGRVLALMLISSHGGDYYAIMAAKLVPAIVDRLRIYVLRANVAIESLSGHTVLGLQAEDEPQLPPDSLPVIPMPGGDERLKLSADFPQGCTDTLEQDAWKVAELKRGITWLHPETSGQFLPQMLGFDRLGAVNFKKGCYPGQEIVARTHYLGKIKRHPRLLCTRAVVCPEPLDTIEIHSGDEQHEAVIADCGHNEDGGGCLFTVTRMEPGLTVEVMEFHGQICPVTP